MVTSSVTSWLKYEGTTLPFASRTVPSLMQIAEGMAAGCAWPQWRPAAEENIGVSTAPAGALKGGFTAPVTGSRTPAQGASKKVSCGALGVSAGWAGRRPWVVEKAVANTSTFRPLALRA